MTRNEWIAETAARLAATRTSDTDALIVRCALDLAECLESQGLAPWQSAHPLSDAAAKVVEAAVNYVDAAPIGDCDFEVAAAVRAYKESVK